MTILQLLASDSFITYSKHIAKIYGVNGAIILGAMCSYQNSFGDEEFFKSEDKISEDTSLSIYEVKQAIKILKDNEILSVIKKGMPSRNYYYVSANKLGKILLTSELKFNQQESKNLTDLYNNKNTSNNNTINNKIKKESKPTEFDILINDYTSFEPLKEAIIEFIKMRKLKKNPLTTHALELILKKLNTYSGDNEDTKIAILNKSIMNGWQGVFPLKVEQQKQTTGNQFSIMAEIAKEYEDTEKLL